MNNSDEKLDSFESDSPKSDSPKSESPKSESLKSNSPKSESHESTKSESHESPKSESPKKPFYLILGDEQGNILDQLKRTIGRPLLSEPSRNKEKLHNWYLFKGDQGIYWWLKEGNSSLNHQFMIFKNPIIVIIINYRYSEKKPIEKLDDFYRIITQELVEGNLHPNLKLMVIGYKFQKNLVTHRSYKKDILSWCLARQHETGEEDFCDYLEDFIVS